VTSAAEKSARAALASLHRAEEHLSLAAQALLDAVLAKAEGER
jgi:hypothetical protein